MTLRDPTNTPASSGLALPLEAMQTSSGPGWAVRLPVRAEDVTVSKAVLVHERVVVRRRFVPEVARVQAEVVRERLRADTQGQVDVVGTGSDLVAEPTSADDRHSSINIDRPGAHDNR